MKNKNKKNSSGFSLIEIMVSIAILSLIIAMCGTILNQVLQSTRLVNRQIQTQKSTHITLNILRNDLAGLLPLQNGLSAILVGSDEDSNSKISFLTKWRPSIGNSSRFIAVTYQLVDHNLIRYVSAVDWNTADLLQAISSSEKSDIADIVAENILRFEIVAKKKDGTLSPLLEAANQTFDGQPLPPNCKALLNTDIRGLIVALAVLDEVTVPSSTYSQMSDLLSPTKELDQSPLEQWRNDLSDDAIKTIPASQMKNLQLSQYIYDLP